REVSDDKASGGPTTAAPRCPPPGGSDDDPAQRLVRVTLSVADDRATLEVSDTGRGPEPRLQGRMFDPLVTGKPDGAGLGLFIARDVVQRHGGRIDWRRQDNMTSFIVELPTAARERAGASPRSLASPTARAIGG